ncbi:MAG TPA: hypothetical protein VMP01_24940 [Pirellulaceae bacterium]|nr:hypothetical protein [Pirellulaceae bacterium]
MIRQPRQKLTLAELLIVLAMVGIGLGTARRYWHAWGTEEWTLATAWIAAWIFAVLGVRAITCRAVLAASVLCPLAVSGVAVYFQFSWRTTFILVVAALAIAAVTAAVPWLISRGGSWVAAVCSGKSRVSRTALLRFAAVAIAVGIGGVAIVWLRQPPVSTTIIRRFENFTRSSENQRQNRMGLHCVSDAGRFLVLRSRNAVEIFDTESGTIRAVPNSSALGPVAISPDGRRLGCLTRNPDDIRTGVAYCVDVHSGTRLVEFRISFPFAIVSFSNDACFVVGTSSRDLRRLEMERWRLDPSAELVDRWRFECPDGAMLQSTSEDGQYCRIEFSDDHAVNRWQVWTTSPPAELIIDSKDEIFASGRGIHANGEWFAQGSRFWNRARTTEVEGDGTVLAIDRAGDHAAVLRYNGNVGPPFPQVGLSDEVMDQLPFWRLLNDRTVEVQLWLYDVEKPDRIWQSPATTIRPFFHWRLPVFNTHTAPDRSAIALQDDTGRIILWRIHRSPFADR